MIGLFWILTLFCNSYKASSHYFLNLYQIAAVRSSNLLCISLVNVSLDTVAAFWIVVLLLFYYIYLWLADQFWAGVVFALGYEFLLYLLFRFWVGFGFVCRLVHTCINILFCIYIILNILAEFLLLILQLFLYILLLINKYSQFPHSLPIFLTPILITFTLIDIKFQFPNIRFQLSKLLFNLSTLFYKHIIHRQFNNLFYLILLTIYITFIFID